ncbi:MAG: hydrogenase iron-sulfur subunit [Burkholderiaceae bacterium]
MSPGCPAAVVDPANCNGCSRCFDDCPYGAIVMRAHVEPRRHHAMAEVRAGDCAACGICAGSCPSATPFRGTERLASGIDIPSLPVDAIRERLREALLALPVSGGVLVFACECAAAPLAVEGAKSVMLSCAGQLPPAFVEYALRQGAGTVVVNACPPGDCEYRFGAIFCADRLERRREPSLRMGVERGQVVLSSHGRGHEDRLRARIATLRIRTRLAGLAAHAEPPDDGVRGNG